VEEVNLCMPGTLVKARGREWAVLPGSIPLPSLDSCGNAASARMLANAARLAIRTGVGPFRSFGRMRVVPRPYQWVTTIRFHHAQSWEDIVKEWESLFGKML